MNGGGPGRSPVPPEGRGRDWLAVPWWNRIPAILGYPLGIKGLLAAVVLGVVSYIGSFGGILSPFGLMIRLCASGLVFSTMFLIVREAANGSEEFPDVGVSDLWEDLIAPGLKATLLGIVLAAPAIYCVVQFAFGMQKAAHSFEKPGPRGGFGQPAPGNPWADPQAYLDQHPGLKGGAETKRMIDGTPGSSTRPVPGGKKAAPPAPKDEYAAQKAAASAMKWVVLAVLFGFVAMLVYPICFIVLAIGGSLRMALFPVVWFTILGQVFVPYLGLLLGLFLLSTIEGMAVAPFALASGHIPILPTVAGRMVMMYFAMTQAHLLGWFVFQYHERLGYTPVQRVGANVVDVARMKADALAYAQGKTPRGPVGGVMVGASAAPIPQMYEGPPVNGAPWDGPQAAPGEDEIAGLAARFSSACTSRDLQSAHASAPLLMDAYWQAVQSESAHSVYRTLIAVDADFCFDPERQLRLSKELESAGDYPLAATAWRAFALKNSEHTQAPRALFRCAECYTKAGRFDWAKKAFEILIQRYPMSDSVGPAKARLRGGGG